MIQRLEHPFNLLHSEQRTSRIRHAARLLLAEAAQLKRPSVLAAALQVVAHANNLARIRVEQLDSLCGPSDF